MKAELTDADRGLIKQLVVAVRTISHNIVEIRCEESGRILVFTGHRGAPKAGSGHYLEATKHDDGQWKLQLIGKWQS